MLLSERCKHDHHEQYWGSDCCSLYKAIAAVVRRRIYRHKSSLPHGNGHALRTAAAPVSMDSKRLPSLACSP